MRFAPFNFIAFAPSARATLLLAALITFAGALFSSAARAEFDPPVMLRNATVIPAPGKSIPRCDVLIRDGRIAAVGPSLNAPAGAETLPADDMVIYAGFIDANTNAGMPREEPAGDQRTVWEDENPDVVQGPQSATVHALRRMMHPQWRTEELYDPKADKLDDWRALGFATALVSPRVVIVSGTSAVVQLGDLPRRRSILRGEVAMHAAFLTRPLGTERPQRGPGGRFERPADFGYPGTTMGAMAAFRQVMSDAQWHRDVLAWSLRHPQEKRAANDSGLEALWPALDNKMPVAFFANSENEIHRTLDMAAEFKLRPIIVGGREAWRVTERLKREAVPIILSLNWSKEPKAPGEKDDRGARGGRGGRRGGSGGFGGRRGGPRGDRGGDRPDPESESPDDENKEKEPDKPKPGDAYSPIFDDEWEKQPFEPKRVTDERKRLWGEEVDNALRLHEAGIAFAIGTFEMKSLADIHANLRKAIERGLPEDVALAALTTNAAGLLGVADQLGEIAPGRLANLVVMNKPFKDEKAKTRWVFVEGKRFTIDASALPEKEPTSQPTSAPMADSAPGSQPAPETVGDAHPTTQDASLTPQVSSLPSSQPTSAPTSQPAQPTFAVEIEADRKPATQTGGNVLLRNATLLTITQGDQPQTDILIEKGVIKTIGKNLSAPAGAATLDLSGYFVSPGIIDCHSHMCSEGGLNEGTLSVTPEVRIGDIVNHRDVAAFRALAGGVTMIHTMHGSANTIGGQNVVLRLKYGKPAAEWRFEPAPRTVKFALGENVKQANSNTRGTRFPNSRMGVEAVFRRSFDAAMDYKHEWGAYRSMKDAGQDPRPPRRDLRLEALAAIHDGLIWVHCHCYRADEVLRLLAMAEDFGFRIAVLQHILEGYRVIPEMRRHGCGASTFSDWWAYKIEAYDATPFNAARMEQGGVNATVNSDSAELVRHLNLEAAKSLRFGGLSPNDCMKLVTLNGAMQLGVAEHVGSLEAGKLGDLAIFDSHPLDTRAKCVMTLIDGEVYFQHRDFAPAGASAGVGSAHATAAPMGQAISPRSQVAALPMQRAPLNIPYSHMGLYWITGVTAHPISGPPIENALVAMADGDIFLVAPWAEQNPNPETVFIDGKGLHVWPGLINADTNMGLHEIDMIAATVDENEIAEFQPDLMALSAYNPFATAINVTRCEGVTNAMVMPGGGRVSGQAGLVKLTGWSMPEAMIESYVGQVVSLPSLPDRWRDDTPPDRIEEQTKNTREQMARIEDFFRKAKTYAAAKKQAHISSTLEISGGLKPDRLLDAMIPIMDGTKPVFFAANGHKQIREALKFAERYGLRPIIVGGQDAWKVADELAAKKVDVILRGAMTPYPGEFDPWDSSYRNAAELARAGVRFCFGTGEAPLAKHVGIEAGMSVAHGLDEARAMQAITLDAARILGVDDRLGSLEPGKMANLFISTDSPLQASNQVVALFIDGQQVELTSRHTEHDDKWRKRPMPGLGGDPTLRGRPALQGPVTGRSR